MQKLNIVLVPSTGNLYIYTNPWCGTKNDDEFSSPPRGIYISTNWINTQQGGEITVLVPSTGNLYIYFLNCIIPFSGKYGSRPLHGESIYLLIFLYFATKFIMFSSPPRGIYISTAGYKPI